MFEIKVGFRVLNAFERSLSSTEVSLFFKVQVHYRPSDTQSPMIYFGNTRLEIWHLEENNACMPYNRVQVLDLWTQEASAHASTSVKTPKRTRPCWAKTAGSCLQLKPENFLTPSFSQMQPVQGLNCDCVYNRKFTIANPALAAVYRTKLWSCNPLIPHEE